MRISDWSSDVCSSDLAERHLLECPLDGEGQDVPRRREVRCAVLVDVLERVARGPELGIFHVGAPSGSCYLPAARAADWMVRSISRGLSRSEEHTSEIQSLMRISYAVFCLTKKKYYII